MTRTPIIAVSLFAVFALVLLVLAAISAGVFGLLLGGVVALVLIARYIVVDIVDRMTASFYKMRNLRYNHEETVLRLGYQPIGANYQLLPAPQQEQEDLPVSLSGETNSTLEAYRQDAIELLALSALEMPQHRDAAQIIPSYKAVSNPYFADTEIWMNAVKYLRAHGIAYEKRNGNRRLGTFLSDGTVGQALDKLKQSTPLPARG